MSITELIEQLKAMPEKMEGRNSEGEFVVINTNKLADSLKKSLRNCDVGTAEEQARRYEELCDSHTCGSICSRSGCPLYAYDCSPFAWAQMPYEEGGAE